MIKSSSSSDITRIISAADSVEKGCLEFVSILLIELLFVLGGLVGLFTAILFHCRRRAGPGSIDFVTNFKNAKTFGHSCRRLA